MEALSSTRTVGRSTESRKSLTASTNGQRAFVGVVVRGVGLPEAATEWQAGAHGRQFDRGLALHRRRARGPGARHSFTHDGHPSPRVSARCSAWHSERRAGAAGRGGTVSNHQPAQGAEPTPKARRTDSNCWVLEPGFRGPAAARTFHQAAKPWSRQAASQPWTVHAGQLVQGLASVGPARLARGGAGGGDGLAASKVVTSSEVD